MTSAGRILLAFSGGFCGGAERMMIELRELLSESGYSVPLVLNTRGETSGRLAEHQPKLIDSPRFADKRRPLSYIRSVLHFTKLIRAAQPQVVIVEGKILTQIGAAAGKLCRTPVLSYVHYPPSEYEVSRMLYRYSTELVLCCDGLRPYFGSLSVPCTTVRNYVDSKRYAPADAARRAALKLERFNIEPETICISLVGHLSAVKGQETLLKALRRLHDDGCFAAVLLAGSDNDPQGANEARIRTLVQQLGLADAVRLSGKLAEPQQAYLASDIFALPSRREGLPLAVLEAMACGLPVAASRVDGTPEAVIDGETGFLVEAGDVSGLSDRLKRLIDSAELRHKLGEAGRTRAMQEFTKERWSREFLSLAERFCGTTSEVQK